MGDVSIPKVYTAIAAVMAELSAEGISKDRRNSQQGYNFRGIDDVYNALSPVLAKHRLVMLPRILSRDVVERLTSGEKPKPLFYVTVEAEFDLISAEDGSKHVIRTFGEAMDMADKATNKAMSAAYKYAAMQAFAIPTEGDNDADAHTHEVAPQLPEKGPSKAAVREDMKKFTDDIRTAENKIRLKAIWDDIPWDRIPKDWVSALTKEKDDALRRIIDAAVVNDFPGDIPPTPNQSLDRLAQEARQ